MELAADRPEIILHIENLSLRLGTQSILRNVTLSVRRGEYLSLIGPNGAGKTTLLRCLNRLHSRIEGEIRLEQKPLSFYSQKELARRIGYVPQAGEQAFSFTVEQFVAMGRYPYLSPFSSMDAQGLRAVQQAMHLTGVEPFARRGMDTLSGGERQKVYLAAALAQDTDILLLDEPTTFLDYRRQEEMQEVLTLWRQNRPITILAVTHDLNRAVLHSDRIVALREGSLVFQGSPRELMRPETLQSIYQTSFLMVAHPHAALSMVVPHLDRGPIS